MVTFPRVDSWTTDKAFAHRLIWASLALFAAHLPLLLIFKGEFTDGVLQAAYFDEPLFVVAPEAPPARYVPPLYPALMWIGKSCGVDPFLAGRIVSLLAYCLTGAVIAMGTRLFFSQTFSPWASWAAWILWALSPMANRWALHAMSDMVFCFLMTLSLSFFLLSSRASSERNKTFWWCGNLFGLLSLWTRYQGLYCLPAAVISFALNSGWTGRRGPHLLSAAHIISAILIWCGSLWLLSSGLGIHQGQFSERSIYPPEVYLKFALAAFRYLPYAVTTGLLGLAFFGLWHLNRNHPRARPWILYGFLVGLGGLLLQTFFLSFQFRYGLPLLPWLCVLGGLGLVRTPARYRVMITLAMVAWSGTMTAAVCMYQHETFGDMARLAHRVPHYLEPGQRVWACEEYNPLYRNVKLSVWSGFQVDWLDEQSLPQVRPGDLVVNPNVYPIPPSIFMALRQNWSLRTLAEETSRTMPLFPGEILILQVPTPQGNLSIRSTSQPELMAYRYTPQYYETSLYRIFPRSAESFDANQGREPLQAAP